MDQCLQVAWIAGSEAITEQSNFIFSPMCLRAGLALLATGADGETLRQMLAFLGSEHIHQLNATSAGLLAEMQAWPQLVFAAGIFVDRSLRLRPEFQSTAAAAHGAFTRSVDFRNQADAVAAEVNGFISQTTNGCLTNVIPPGTLRCVWFGDQALFHRLDDTRVRVPFLSDPGMHYAAKFEFHGLEFKVLQLFYKMVGRDGQVDFGFGAPCFCMLVFLPIKRDGLRDVLRMAVTEPDFVMRCVPRSRQIVTPCKVPKFKFSSQLDAGGALAQLGLGAPFDPHAARGALRCAVEVDEEGTTAVEAMYSPSSPGYSPGYQPPRPPPMSFVAEHPFMFAIALFHRLDDTRVRVPFLSDPGMHYAAKFEFHGLEFKVLQLFYKMVGRDGQVDFGFGAPCFCMLVFLPIKRDGLRDVLRMAVTEPDFVMRCVPRSRQIVTPCKVPKFKFSSQLDAGGALAQLGLGAPFDPHAARGALRCAVEVDEEGTTAVEAMYSPSSPGYSPGYQPPRPPPMSFVAEHPFMFAIAQVLFLGLVMDPSKED
uniref:Serpin domain-containing protein n=1 Tax=Oryza meridionalis TaxID=40149 RepID=A0A0E0DGM0_9ORYZ